jgi:YVTN family beta-propeller protein
MATGEPLSPGSRVGPYVVEAELGRGGMGVVYVATEERLGRRVALKVIAPELARDATFRRRFERESRLAAATEHPHAVPVYEAGEAGDGTVYISMRLIDGTDLRALLAAEQWLEPGRAARLVDQVAGALDAAHRQGLVHRDVKPANVLIGEPGEREWAYLTDFGLTRRMAGAESALTGSGQWLGTVDYSSPEQVRGDAVDARSDVYSLGCVLHEALTGRIPFEREDEVAKLYAHAHDPPPRLGEAMPDAPPELEGVVARALAKDPGDRFPSAGDLGRAAVAATAGEAVTQPERSVAVGAASPSGAATRVVGRGDGRGLRGRRALAAAALAAVVVVAAWALVVLVGGGEDGGPEVDGTTDVAGQPLALVVSDGVVWVSSPGADSVTRLDGEDGLPLGDPIPVGDRPTGIRTGAGYVWVANSGDDTVSRLDQETGEARGQIAVGDRPAGVAVGEGSVWVTNVDSNTVSRLDPHSARVVQTIRVGRAPADVDVGEGGVWVTNSGDGTVSRIAPGNGEVVGDPIPVGARPRGIATIGGSVWVANALDGSLTRIDSARLTVEETIAVGRRPAQVAGGESYVWVANERDGTVSRVDAASAELAGEPLAVGAGPRGVAIGDDLIWVASPGAGTVARIAP